MPATHGTASTYRNRRYKCRCLECTTANTERARSERESRRERLASNPSLVPHGVPATYSNWGCRCEPCTEANKAACRERKASRKAVA